LKQLSILFFILFSFVQLSFSQEYDLNNYKYRFQKVRGLNTNFDLSGNTRNDDRIFILETDTASISNINTQRNLNYGGNLSYFESINLQHKQQNIDAYVFINGQGNFGSTNINRTDDTFYSIGGNNSHNFSISYSNVLRYYKGKKFNYLNTRASLNASSNNDYEDNGQSFQNTTLKQKRFGGDLSLDAGKGKGRLEFVEDPVLAMFIIKDLQSKAGLGNITTQQIENIAQGITYIKNQRFIDFRFRRIDQITLLDSVFEANGAKPKNALLYFTSLYDNWVYATNFRRTTGKRTTYFLSNNFQSNFNFEDGTADILFNRNGSYHTWNTSLNLLQERFKQDNVNWQSGFNWSLSAGLNQIRYKDFTESYYFALDNTFTNEDIWFDDNLFLQGGIGFSKLYQPNSRTFYRFNLNQVLGGSTIWEELRESNPVKESNLDLTASTRIDVEYFKFFNARLNLNISLGINSDIYNYRSSSNAVNTENSTIGYSIFPRIRARLNYTIF
jgi:hypothetical protein